MTWWRPLPFGRTAKSACSSSSFLIRTNVIHLPSGEKFGSVSHPHCSNVLYGFLVSCRSPDPFGRMSQMPLLVGLESRSKTIHLPSGENDGCP